MEDNRNEMDIMNEIINGEEVANSSKESTNVVIPSIEENINTDTDAIQVTNSSIENNQDIIDLENIDLSFLGIQMPVAGGANQEATQSTDNEVSPSQIDEIKNMINGLSDNNQNSQVQEPQIPEEEANALKELFGKFQDLGLLPKTFGLSEEQQNLLDKAKSINERLEAQEREEKEYEEYHTKLDALKSFNEKLSKTIPGYNTKLIEQTVAEINKSNPEAGVKIFNNPMLLMDLWNEIGAKSQPNQQQDNIISSSSETVNADISKSLEDKVKTANATEQEEAMYLLQQFK